MTFIDFFAGVGGFTAGLTQAGMNCTGFCEKDKFAVKSYTAIHQPNSRKEWFCSDITTANSSNVPYADGWTAGFPCQDISVCGRQAGISGERSGLFYKIVDLLKGKNPENRPKWLLFENVKNLVSINGGGDFTEILCQISALGYNIEWQVINSKLYVPQNRERIFIIGHLRTGTERTRQVFPIAGTATKANTDLIEKVGGMQGNRVYCSKGISVCLTAQGGGLGAVTGLYCTGNGGKRCFIDLCVGNPQTTDIARCIKARYNAGLSNRKAENSGVLTNGGRVRKLTPRECFRLQGFSDAEFDRAAAVNSDNQLYKQAGNSVTVPVVREIGERLIKAYEN